MAKTHTIDGKTYVEVERKAEVGEKVFVLSHADTDRKNIGEIYTVTYSEAGDTLIEVDGTFDDGSTLNLFGHEYRVLEPVAGANTPESPLELTANDIRWQPDKVIDLLANLARRVSSLERQVADTQNNVVRHGEELEAVRYGNDELYLRLKGVEERTANHRNELNVIDHEKAMIFADIVSLSQRIKKLNGGAAE